MIQKLFIGRRQRPFIFPQRLTCRPNYQKLGISKGEIFKGLIVKVYDGGRVLVSAKGKEFYACSRTNLSKGEIREFLVEKVQPSIVLRVLERPVKGLFSPFRIWAQGQASRRLFCQLLNDLRLKYEEGIVSDKQGSNISARICDLVDKLIYKGQTDQKWLINNLASSGLFWENNQARTGKGKNTITAKDDLKGLLIDLIKTHHIEDKEADGLLFQKASALLETIRHVQLLNISLHTRDVGWFWVLPIVQDNKSGQAEVLIRKGEGYFSMWIRLELDPLGVVNFGVSLGQGKTKIKILAKQEKTVKFILEHLSMLKNALNTKNIELLDITCDVLDGSDPILSYLEQTSPEEVHYIV